MNVNGERVMAGVFGLIGVLWVSQALRLRYWGDFAPGSGFLPLWLGGILVALVVAYLIVSRFTQSTVEATVYPRRPLIVGGGLLACVAVIELLGFVVSIAAYIAFLLLVVERRPAAQSAAVAIGTPVVLFLLFKTWLKVPLPLGPWGF
jgi:putative tricarboxylic transport membrane protein